MSKEEVPVGREAVLASKTSPKPYIFGVNVGAMSQEQLQRGQVAVRGGTYVQRCGITRSKLYRELKAWEQTKRGTIKKQPNCKREQPKKTLTVLQVLVTRAHRLSRASAVFNVSWPSALKAGGCRA